MLKALKWLAVAVAGVAIIRYGGDLLFYVPGAIAKTISLALTGSGKGMVTTVFFYLVAGGFVLAIATLGWSIVLVDRWLAERKNKP